MNHDAPIVQKVYDLYRLFYEYIDHFPQKSREVVVPRVEQILLELLELTARASHATQQEKIVNLDQASNRLDLLKILVRLMYDLKIIDQKKYINLETPLQEIGRMLGGWIRSLKTTNPDR